MINFLLFSKARFMDVGPALPLLNDFKSNYCIIWLKFKAPLILINSVFSHKLICF